MNQVGRTKFRMSMHGLGIANLNIMKYLMNVEASNFIKRQLSVKQSCFVDLYILNCQNLASRDIGSASDPFIRVKCDKTKYNTEKDHIDDEPNPDFFQKFTFEAGFPGTSNIVLDIVDYDDLFGNDLIGSTYIDLEDRFFSHQF